MIIIEPTEEKEISYQAVYYHFRKWSRDGSFKRVHENSSFDTPKVCDTYKE